MESPVSRIIINTREDLDSIVGTPQHDEFMEMLKGSIYRLEKDDEAKTWVAVKDLTLIKQFGFALKDFPNVKPPELPEYVPPPSKVPQVVTMRQARLALLNATLLQAVIAAVDAIPGTQGNAAKIEWEYAQEVRRDSMLVAYIATALSLTDAQLDELFTEGALL